MAVVLAVFVGIAAPNSRGDTYTIGYPTIDGIYTTITILAGTHTFSITSVPGEKETDWLKAGVKLETDEGVFSYTPSFTTTLAGGPNSIRIQADFWNEDFFGTRTNYTHSTGWNVFVVGAPTIAVQPASQTLAVGTSATFFVAATGDATLTYQWQKNGSNIFLATGASYIQASAQTSDNGAVYRCIVTNSRSGVSASTTSNSATLTVVSVPTPIASAASQVTTTAFQANWGAISGINGLRLDVATDSGFTNLVTNYDNRAVNGNASSETVSGLSAGVTYYYRVRAYLFSGATSPNSNVIAVTTSGAGPTITTQPVSLAATAGGTASFSVTATGTAPLTYQWRKDGTTIGGATNTTYTLSSVQASDAGRYSVVVTNSVGSVTSSDATLTVNVAPAITTQPASLTVTANSNATFSVVATGTPTPTYQWRKDGTSINGATNATLSLNNVQAANAGGYTVVVTNSVGSVTSSAATLTVNSGPVITTQPVAQSALAGTSATFSVVATGTAPLTYQWRKDGNAIAGATNASMTLTGVQTTDAGGYSVVVTNSIASVTSNTVALTVTVTVVAPGISTQPANQSAAVGGSATFAVVATGTTPSYQWQKDGVTLSGATAAALTLSSIQASDAGDYTVVVSNSAGSVTSTAARLTVVALPTITTQPTAQTVALGGSATLTVVATGTAPLTYQWRKDGSAIAGATAASLTLSEVTAAAAGNYLVVVTNNAGAVTSNVATVTVSVPPAITAQPADQSVAIGTPATFTVSVTGTAPLSYQWRKDGAPVSGATGASLSLARVQATDAGSYTVLVSNAAGSVLSVAARLTVAAAPEITTQPASIGVAVGTTATFTVVAIGAEPLTYQWQRDGVPLSGRTTATLGLTNVQVGDAGGYRVVVTNPAGSVTSSVATLSVTNTVVPPTIVAQPESQSRGIGTNVTFRVGVSGTSPFTFQWRKNGAAIPDRTSDALILPNVSLVDVGNYTVVVSNSQGSATSNVATLAIITAPTITTPPVDQSVASGASASFLVVATGSPPLTYQWFKDGTAIAGATNSILPRDQVADADAGSYWVTVANGAGPVTSRAATLVVSGAASRLSNLSVRTTAGAGSQTLIVGFVVAGPGSKPVLVRGIGPSLAAFGVSGALSDPLLALYQGSILLATNDNWGDPPLGEQVGDAARRLGAFALLPTSRDSALLSSLQPESYTAQVVARGTSGTALVELYDGNSELPSRIVNVSARCLVGTGGDVLIAGFYISGNVPKTVLLRAVGPTLAAFGVSDALANPQLVVQSGTEVRATNDDWWLNNGAATLPPVFSAVGAFPLAANSRDAALVVTLPPGQYTAQIAGANSTTGVALVEIYEVP